MKMMLIPFILLIFFSSTASAEDNDSLTMKEQVKLNDKAKEGWTPELKSSLNYTANSSKDVIGQDDGDTITFGFKLESGINYKKKTNEWRNSLDYSGATTKTSSLPRYVKSSDALKFSTLYLYGLKSMPKVGPYASASAETAAFKGENIQSTDKTYITPSGNFTGSTLKLTDALAPLTTKEAIGFFYKAIEREKTKLEFRIGIGAMQVAANDQLKISDEDDTTVTIEALESYSQAGLEYGLSYKGKWNVNSSYKLTADFLTPMGTEVEKGSGKPCEECSEIELTNIEIKAGIESKVVEGVKIGYEYKAVKMPQLLNKFQIQHGFILAAEYDYFGK